MMETTRNATLWLATTVIIIIYMIYCNSIPVALDWNVRFHLASQAVQFHSSRADFCSSSESDPSTMNFLRVQISRMHVA